MKKMNTLLAVTAGGQATFKAAVKNYAQFFKGGQGAFIGEKRTYEAADDTVDDPTKRGNTLVQTTVDEKFAWLKENSVQDLNDMFTVEKANANNIVTDLEVDGKSWGALTTLELLRLKGLLEDSGLMTMMANIPVRSDSEEWEPTSAEQYKGRDGIFESPKVEGESKTTDKETYIIVDPNIAKLKEGAIYTPITAVKNTVRTLGTSSRQSFTGEWSQRQKAETIQKRNTLYKAVIEALKVANDTEIAQESTVGTSLFDYLF